MRQKFRRLLIFFALLTLSIINIIFPICIFIRRHYTKYRSIPICQNNQRQCVPPFVEFEKRFRVAPRFKLNFCAIEKNMSTVMTAIACLLLNEKEFRESQRNINTELFHRRFCKRQNEAFSMEQLARKFNTTGVHELEQHWLHLAVMRDPVDRFLSAFVDKCVRARVWRDHPARCNGCRQNMTCFVHRQFERMQRRARGHARLNSFDDRHFNPQSWRCQFNEYFRFFTIIRYSSDTEGSSHFFSSLFNHLRLAGVPEESIRLIRNQTGSGRAPHATHGKQARLRAEKLLRNRPQLMEMLVKMYYYDFVLFGYPVPTINY